MHKEKEVVQAEVVVDSGSVAIPNAKTEFQRLMEKPKKTVTWYIHADVPTLQHNKEYGWDLPAVLVSVWMETTGEVMGKAMSYGIHFPISQFSSTTRERYEAMIAAKKNPVRRGCW